MDTKATIETIIHTTGQADGHAAHLRLRRKWREPGGPEPPPPLARADEIHLKCPSVAPRASLPRGPQIRGRVAVGSTRMRRPGSELISSELESSWHAAKRRPGPVRPYGPAAGVLVRLVYLDHDILNIMVSQFLSENIPTGAPGLGARDRRRRPAAMAWVPDGLASGNGLLPPKIAPFHSICIHLAFASRWWLAHVSPSHWIGSGRHKFTWARPGGTGPHILLPPNCKRAKAIKTEESDWLRLFLRHAQEVYHHSYMLWQH